MTLDDILNGGGTGAYEDVHEVLLINPVTRQIEVPSAELILGVETDRDSEVKAFVMPPMIGAGLDVCNCNVRVYFRNANGEEDYYAVDSVETLDDGSAMFIWLLGPNVTKYKGDVQFSVCLCKSVDGMVCNEWNTTTATGKVLEGLEPLDHPDEEFLPDIIGYMEDIVKRAERAASNPGDTVRITDGSAAIRITTSSEVPEEAVISEGGYTGDKDARIKLIDGELYIVLPDDIWKYTEGEVEIPNYIFEPGTCLKITRGGAFGVSGDGGKTFDYLVGRSELDYQMKRKVNKSGDTLTGPLYYKNTSNQFLRTDNIIEWGIANMDTWVPFFGAFHIGRVQQKNYTGTGIYGESNAKVLTFDFQPKLIIVKKKDYLATNSDGTEKTTGFNETMMMAFYGTPSAVSSRYFGSGIVYSYQTNLTWSGKSVSWWGQSETRHLNVKNNQYHVLAIG